MAAAEGVPVDYSGDFNHLDALVGLVYVELHPSGHTADACVVPECKVCHSRDPPSVDVLHVFASGSEDAIGTLRGIVTNAAQDYVTRQLMLNAGLSECRSSRTLLTTILASPAASLPLK